jgi:trehalose 6-phosphate phosphatase
MHRAGMQEVPASEAGRAGRLLADTREWALFVDIDGTLLDMAPTPDAVRVPPELVQTLGDLKTSLNGAVAFVTGRRIVDVDRFFAPLRMVALGVHGAEARIAPRGPIEPLVEPVPRDLTMAVRAATEAMPGILVEDKGVGLAVHYRNAPQMRGAIELELRRIVMRWERFTLRHGRKVLELVAKERSKGTGLVWLSGLPIFKGRRPVMIGDDSGDEPALKAAERLGGMGLRVAGEHFGRDEADFDSPASVRSWLAGVQAARAR